MADDVVTLIMMTQNDNAAVELLTGKLDALIKFEIGHRDVIFENLDLFKQSGHHLSPQRKSSQKEK